MFLRKLQRRKFFKESKDQTSGTAHTHTQVPPLAHSTVGMLDTVPSSCRQALYILAYEHNDCKSVAPIDKRQPTPVKMGVSKLGTPNTTVSPCGFFLEHTPTWSFPCIQPNLWLQSPCTTRTTFRVAQKRVPRKESNQTRVPSCPLTWNPFERQKAQNQDSSVRFHVRGREG